jgi:hypothetical protein
MRLVRGSFSMKSLKRQIDAVHARVIRKLEGDACFVCGNTDSPQCGHLFGRSDISDSAYRAAYVRRFGQDALDALELRANTTCQVQRDAAGGRVMWRIVYVVRLLLCGWRWRYSSLLEVWAWHSPRSNCVCRSCAWAWSAEEMESKWEREGIT